MKKLIAGNWKMNGLLGAMEEVMSMVRKLDTLPDDADCLICPPATLLHTVSAVSGPRIIVGGQYCHVHNSGPHTGDISAEMLADAGATFVIVGHSERRADHYETDDIVARQAETAVGAGLVPIICLGESLDQRQQDLTLSVISEQLEQSIPENIDTSGGFLIAYEPIWAIGTGEVATVEQIEQVHRHIRGRLIDRFGQDGEQIRILYGGSMKPENAAEILAIDNVDGGLIGGASLKADAFISIYRAAIDKD
ncbi:MAG: triose-phosphate isomerase [Hyphomonas sp. TMED17]|nr:MAG: triose-phosphate isomerase [Hyphomonas sp. TMED17]